MKSPEGEDWKKRLKALGIVRKKNRDLLRRKEGERPGEAAAPAAGEAPADPSPFKEISPRTLHNVTSGRLGEDAACALLTEKSLLILARNVRYPNGEIDIVALEGSVVVFVEVKWRRDDSLGSPAEAVTPRKRARVVRAARRWLAAHPSRARSVRFDVVAIREEPPEVAWIRGAFDASGA